MFAEQQVYRIDHYLGKETVQNMLVLRFANSIFEPVWNRRYIDHVQITAAEEVTVGRRGGYYDKSGVLRDMFQNHLLQLLTVTAMESPVRYQADAVRDEKVKVLSGHPADDARRSRRDTLRGQYRGYTQEPDVARRQPNRHVRRRETGGAKLALARRAVLFAQRQSHVVPHHANRHSVPRAAAHAVSRAVRAAFKAAISSSSKCNRPKESNSTFKPKFPMPA